MDNRHLFSRRKYSNKTNPKERVEAHGFGLTSGRSPRRASASIIERFQIILLPEVEGSGALNCVTKRICTGRNVAIKNLASKTWLF